MYLYVFMEKSLLYKINMYIYINKILNKKFNFNYFI